MPTDFHHELTIAIQAARRAGGLLRMHLERGVQARTKSSPIDLVTEADGASEALIVNLLAEAFPGYGIVSEEGGGSSPDSVTRWVVDPLDGTTNFAHGYPQFAVSIALQDRGASVAGVVYDVMRDELFTAIRGQGAYLNGRPLHVSSTPSLEGSLLVTGFPYDRRTSSHNNLDHFAAFLMQAQGVLRPGSASLDLAAVASGRLDGYWEYKLWPWDIAAGTLLVTESGGRVTGADGNEIDFAQGHLVASNGLIHDAMVAQCQALCYTPHC